MKKTFKITSAIVITIFMAMSFESQAQQDPMYSQYMFNTMSVNPGYAGSRGALNVTGLYRNQWTGIEGAPVSQTILAHTPLFNDRVGVGLSVVNDKVGPINMKVFYTDYSYTVNITEESKLAFGLKAGFNVYKAGFTDLSITDGGDNLFSTNIENEFTPNFGFGMYYHAERYYVGVSAPKLIENKIGKGVSWQSAKEQRHYFAIAGYVMDVGEEFKFKPSTLVKITNGAPLSIDLSAMMLYREQFWFGLATRFGESVQAIIQLNINEQLAVGYAFDHVISQLSPYTGGSHEIMLSYDFNFKKGKILSPRYF